MEETPAISPSQILYLLELSRGYGPAAFLGCRACPARTIASVCN
jgi:hypothetical protein